MRLQFAIQTNLYQSEPIRWSERIGRITLLKLKKWSNPKTKYRYLYFLSCNEENCSVITLDVRSLCSLLFLAVALQASHRKSVFTARRYGYARSLLSFSVHYICHVGGLYSYWLDISSNFFLGPRNRHCADSEGNPLSGGTNTRGWENFAIFDWNRRLYRKWYL